MRKILCILLLNFILLVNANASIFSFEDKYSDDQGPYLGIMSGLVNFDTNSRHYHLHMKPGYYVSGFFGYKFPYHFKLEGEICFQEWKVDHYEHKANGTWRSLSYMINTIYEFNCNLPITPYVGFGMGYADTNARWKSKFIPEHDCNFLICLDDVYCRHTYKMSGFAWQPIIGINYLITSHFKVGLDYRLTGIKNDFKYHKIGFSLTGIF